MVVIYMKDPVPIEIGVKPVKKELWYEEDTEEYNAYMFCQLC